MVNHGFMHWCTSSYKKKKKINDCETQKKKRKKKIVGKPHLLRQVEVAQKKIVIIKRKCGKFCPTFTLIFSPIWRDCVLEGEERKLMDPTKISPLFHPQPWFWILDCSLNRKRERFKIFEVESRLNRGRIVMMS